VGGGLTLVRACDDDQINPKHLEEGQDNSVGRLQLELILQKLATRIFTSLPYFPLYLRQLCHMLYEDMRYDHPDYIHRVLGNLIFLRFIVRCRRPTHVCGGVCVCGGACACACQCSCPR
jgi:hypothetical protein